MKIEIKSSEILVLLAASVMSFLANLPDQILGNLVDRKMLLGALTALVIVAMFRYLQMLLLLTISILAVGANLPTELASTLGVSQTALLVSLGALISITLLNRVLKLLPTARETSHTDDTQLRQAMMMGAIAKGDMATILRLLAMNAEVNFNQDGTTPLHLATEKGYPDIVRALMGHGANFNAKDAQGRTPLEIALQKKKFIQTTEILLNASKSHSANAASEENRRADGEQWRSQHS